MWGPRCGSPGMPLTTVSGLLLRLASFMLFVPNIYSLTQAQPSQRHVPDVSLPGGDMAIVKSCGDYFIYGCSRMRLAI